MSLVSRTANEVCSPASWNAVVREARYITGKNVFSAREAEELAIGTGDASLAALPSRFVVSVAVWDTGAKDTLGSLQPQCFLLRLFFFSLRNRGNRMSASPYIRARLVRRGI